MLLALEWEYVRILGRLAVRLLRAENQPNYRNQNASGMYWICTLALLNTTPTTSNRY